MRKISAHIFIERAKAIHGDKYDYSKVNYVDSKTKVCIICQEHGEFWQFTHNHLKGCGCPKCSNNARYTTEEYIRMLQAKHPNSPYSFDEVIYDNNHSPILLRCKEHGLFSTLPSSLNKKLTECPLCQKKRISEQMTDTTESFLEKSYNIHQDKYDTSKVHYVNAKTKVCFICHQKDKYGNEHGEFWQLPSTNLKGCGCPKCSNEHLWDKRKDKQSTASFIEKANISHNGKYSYNNSVYNGTKTKLCITCPEHGDFWMLPYAHLNGQGCPKCGRITLASYFVKDLNEIIKEANIVHNNKYDYSKAIYKNYNTKMCIICTKHGDFWQSPNSHLHGHGCPLCAIGKNSSIGEDKLVNFTKSLINDEVITNSRNIIPPNELDIYIPKLKVAIEYNGLYWHSINFVDEDYHLNKAEKCNQKGIRLIQIFEDEFETKEDIVKSLLTHILRKTTNRIYARKCNIKTVNEEEAKEFLNENHLQGYIKSDYYYGLFSDEQLISIMSFSLKDGIEKSYSIDRFCTKKYTAIIGGASKLLSYFITDINPSQIIVTVDRKWSKGNLYKKLGFSFDCYVKPISYYFQNNKRIICGQATTMSINEKQENI